jgi:hypothetical protein
MLLVTLVTFLTLFPCAFAQGPEQKPSTQPAAPPAEAKADLPAMVYIYRYGRSLSEKRDYVYCDEEEIAVMHEGRYLVIKLEPGRHSFRSVDKGSGGWLIVKPGETYYLRFDTILHFPKIRRELRAVLPEQATYELKNMQYLGADRIKSPRVLLGDPGAPK